MLFDFSIDNIITKLKLELVPDTIKGAFFSAVTAFVTIAITRIWNYSTRAKFCKFFGVGKKVNTLYLVYGTHFCEAKDGFQKKYLNKEKTASAANLFKIVATETVEGISLLVRELAPKLETPFKWFLRNQPYSRPIDLIIVADQRGMNIERDKTSQISIAGPAANELTSVVMGFRENIFFKFNTIDPENFFLIAIIDGKNYKLKSNKEVDYGVVLRIKNPKSRQDSNEASTIICAGIGPQGTEAAADYLSNNWKDLYKRFNSKQFNWKKLRFDNKALDFGICVRVNLEAPNTFELMTEEMIKSDASTDEQ